MNKQIIGQIYKKIKAQQLLDAAPELLKALKVAQHVLIAKDATPEEMEIIVKAIEKAEGN